MFDSKRIRFRQVIHKDLLKLILTEIWKSYGRQQVFDNSIDNISVPHPTKIFKSVNECFDHIRFVLVQNAAFNITNAGENNAAFIFVIGIVGYKMRGYFYFQATGSKWS